MWEGGSASGRKLCFWGHDLQEDIGTPPFLSLPPNYHEVSTHSHRVVLAALPQAQK
jgi:hypothetical protein